MRLSTNNKYTNLVTGESLEMLKVKPDQDMRNTCKIQLYDATTGSLKSETVAENVISNQFGKLMTRLVAVYHVFTWYPVNAAFANRTLFGMLVLTDYTGQEDPSLGCIKGNIIGWADKYRSYAGADTQRGSINVAETGLIDENKVRFVFDFGTGVANGTTGTIFWCPSDHIADTEMYQPLVGYVWFYDSSTVLNPPSSSDYGPLCVVGPKLYHTKGGIIYSTLMSGAARLVRNSDTTTEEADLSEYDTNLRGIQWDGEYFWVWGEQKDNMLKLNASFEVVASYPMTSATYFGNSYKDYVVFDDYLYTIKYINTTTINLYKFSLVDMALVGTYNILQPGGNYASWGIKSDTLRMTRDENNLIVLNGSTGTNVRSYSASIIEVSTNGEVLGDYGMWWGESVPYSICFNPKYKFWESVTRVYNLRNTPASQTLLPTPITKTASDFMKIIFEFDISSLDL